MPRSSEIDHYAWLLSSLIVTAVRAKTVAALSEVQIELAQTISEVLEIVLHDAGPVDAPFEDLPFLQMVLS